VAPFADEASLSSQVADWGSARLSEMLARGPFQIVPWSRVGDMMRQLGIRRSELISPSKTVALGQAVGADAVITGRVIMVQADRDDSDLDDRRFGGGMVTRVDVDVRVLEVRTRLNLFQDTFSCTAPHWPNSAMECILRDVASRIRQ
jgi:curli biogenesis system outer membrane secretion channel CsgG